MKKLTENMEKALRTICQFEPMALDSYQAKRIGVSSVCALIDRGLIEVIEHREWRLTDAGREVAACDA